MTTPTAIAAFFEESDSHLETMESSLLALEKKSGNKELVNELFRAAHSLKGNAGLVALHDIHSTATTMETTLEEIRQSGAKVGQEQRDLLFSLLDTLKSQVEDARNLKKPAKSKADGAKKPASSDAAPAKNKTEKSTESGEAGNGGGRQQVFLTFTLGSEYYGIEINSVKEIILRRHITRVPNAKRFVTGIMNLRGTVVPVIDAKKKLNFAGKSEDRAENIIIVEKDGLNTGVLVDVVNDIVKLDKDAITPSKVSLGGMKSEYITGIGQTEETAVIILDLDLFCDPAEKYC